MARGGESGGGEEDEEEAGNGKRMAGRGDVM